MPRPYIAWVLVGTGEQWPQTVLVRRDGTTDPPDYRLPPHANVSVQMLIRQRDLSIGVEGGRLIVKDRSLTEAEPEPADGEFPR